MHDQSIEERKGRAKGDYASTIIDFRCLFPFFPVVSVSPLWLYGWLLLLLLRLDSPILFSLRSLSCRLPALFSSHMQGDTCKATYT